MKFQFLKAVSCTITLCLSLLATNANAGLIIDSTGIVTGAEDVLVGDSFYNVVFVDGTCIEIFEGCDDISDFTVSNIAVSANSALAALFKESVESNLITYSDVTGCVSSFNVCNVLTFLEFPVGYYNTARVISFSVGNDIARESNINITSDITGQAGRTSVYAKWTLVTVTEPTTLAIFALGLIGLASRQLSKKS
ncbi:MAG: PEP-CTERM sorting domain-containing protein [Paraglaciecola sp.]|nr:PEP-CTERM sorting domain-containing protein [Paraglaciecola sp.]